MARKDDPEPADDFEDDTPAPKRKGFPVWGWALLAVGAVVLVCGGGSVVMAMVFWPGSRPAVTTAGTLPGKVETTVYTREEFRKLVLGKKPAEVIAAVGRPNFTDEPNGMLRYYRYNNRTIDPTTGKVDVLLIVNFRDGVAVSVS